MTSLSVGLSPTGPVPVRIMFDLETLSTQSSANVLSIGAVVFGSQTRAPEGTSKEFYVNVDDRTGHVDVDTVLWWLSQSKEAQQRLLKDRVDMDQALFQFFTWCSLHISGTMLGLNDRKNLNAEFWSRSPSFDEVILTSAYRRSDSRSPFFHRWSRDHRTIEVAAQLAYDPKGGLAHDALSDSIQQASHVLECLSKLNGRLPGLMGGK